MICQSCGTENRVGELVCQNCGDLLTGRPISRVNETQPMPPDMEAKPFEQVQVKEAHLITFEIADSIFRATLEAGTVILVGRDITKLVDNPVLDLANLGAFEKGVSRRHAAIHIAADGIYLIDLGSTNGTFLNDQRLIPHQPVLLRNGDTIHLARMSVRVRLVGTGALNKGPIQVQLG